MKIYRAILADNLKQANKYINSSEKWSGRSFGPGVYWTQDPLIAKEYGNFIYMADIEPIDAKKIINEQEIVLLTADTNQRISKNLVAQFDCGLNAKYSFYYPDWDKEEKQEKIWRSDEFKDVERDSYISSDLPVPDFLKERENEADFEEEYTY